jgi:phosphotransferase system HPr (HPr) family protein
MKPDRPFDLDPPLLHAIGEHKYFLSERAGHEVPFDEATGDFLLHYLPAWRREKIRLDNRAQIEEIQRHKYIRSEKEHRDIGGAAAAAEWTARYAAEWREARESLERNGFERLAVVVTNPRGIHLRPNAELVDIARKFDAEIYVHKPGMELFNFRLQGRPWVSVKSLLAMLSMGIRMGDTLEFIATGRHAHDVLLAVAEAVNAPGGGA